MNELLPCPFCGFDNVEVIKNLFTHHVVCKDCFAHGSHSKGDFHNDDKSYEEAVDAWNKCAR